MVGERGEGGREEEGKKEQRRMGMEGKKGVVVKKRVGGKWEKKNFIYVCPYILFRVLKNLTSLHQSCLKIILM